MRVGCLALAGAILALAASLGTTIAAAPEPVKVRAAAHQGFGRLVLEWPAPVALDSRQQDERLTLRFDRPFATDLAAALDALDDYLVGLERGADRRELVLRLAPGVTARSDLNDQRIVVVDLQRGAAPAGPVAVRTGVHDGFLRIVLDWSEPIDFLAAADDRRLRLTFERAAAIDAAIIGARTRSLVEAASASQGDRRSELRLVLKAGVRAKAFKVEDRQVVIDLYEPSRAPPAASAAAVGPARASAEPARAPAPTKPAPAAAVTDSELPEPAAAPPAADTVPLALTLAAAEVEGGVALDFVWSRPTAAAFLLRAGYLWSVFAPVAASDQTALLPSLASPAPTWLGPGEVVAAAGGSALRFALRRPLAARVERAGERWRVVLGVAAAPPEPAHLERLPDPPRLRIVTGEAGRLVGVTDPEVGDRLEFWPLLTPGLGQPQPQRLVDLELLATAQGLAWRARTDRLRAEIVDGALEFRAPEGLRLSAASITPPGPIAPVAEPPVEPPAPSGRPQVADPVEATDRPPMDQATGTAPAELHATERMETPADAVDRHAPPSAPDQAGPVAAEPPAPIPRAEPAPMAEDQAAPPPGHETAPPAEDQAAPLAPARALPLGLARFTPAAGAPLAEQRALWQQRVLDATAADRPAARLDLARFFLAHGLASEALAVLAVVKADSPADGPQQLARETLTGAAQLLMDRPEDAAAGLEAEALDGDPEVALWRAVLAGAGADWPRAAEELGRSARTLDGYPPALRLRLGLSAARIALEAGRQDETTRLLGLLRALELGPIERARVAFVDGLAQARRGAIDDADRTWGALEQSRDRQTRIEAGYARVQLLLEAGRLSPAEALARLVVARPLWRPHPREFAMLDGLARLYLQNDEPSRALHLWQELLGHFPEAKDAPRITKAMQDGFVATLLPADGVGIGTLRAYALYREFPDLVPEGALGDRLHRRLAAQLAGLDLIAPAADLLDPLIDHLNGPARAQTGADLAELWLRAPDPAAALAALDRSELEGELPEGLRVQRLALRARALAAQDRPDAALAPLEGGTDLIARRLRAEILWQQRDWPRLAGALEDLLGPYADQDTPLATAEQDLVIRLAIAYARQGQVRALAELRERFGAAMRGQAGEPAFLMATLTPGPSPAPEAALAIAGRHVERARAYLDSIRPGR